MKNQNLCKAVLLGLASVSLGACGEPLKKAQEIEEPRVLGVQVTGESGAATPSAGSLVEVSFLLAGPRGAQEARIAFKICEAADSARGVPFCAGETWAEGEIPSGGATPSVSFEVPVGVAPGTRWAVLAAVCVEGAPRLAEDPLDWSCSGGQDPINVSFDAWTEDDPDAVNVNPHLGDLVVTVEGVEITLEDPSAEPTCADGGPTLKADRTHEWTFELGDSVREQGEWLQISHFSTAGVFERQYSVIEPEEEPSVTLEWEAPSQAGALKQYLVVRDGQGGVSFVSWSVCAE